MSKGKLAKFADMERYPNVFQCPYSVVETEPFAMKGRWCEMYFHNTNPIVLELGCGRGEYAVGLARMFPDVNFIGVDIKGARMWSGATQALAEGLTNVAFLRTNIEIIDRFFAPDEVSEIWLTFSDPQMKNVRKRLTGTAFIGRYRRFLIDGGIIHVKTDSNFLYTYTDAMVSCNRLPLLFATTDLYATAADASAADSLDPATRSILSIRTYYETQWLERGLPIRYLKFRLPHSAAPLIEPDIEIPIDPYRSYKRSARTPVEKRK